MSSTIAQRRALKEARRRKILAKQRRQEGGKARAEAVDRVRQWARGPIFSCVIQGGLFERGLGMVVLARKVGIGELATAAFLVDVFCRGIKDVVMQCVDLQEFDGFIGCLGIAAPWRLSIRAMHESCCAKPPATPDRSGSGRIEISLLPKHCSAKSAPMTAIPSSGSATRGGRATSQARTSRTARFARSYGSFGTGSATAALVASSRPMRANSPTTTLGMKSRQTKRCWKKSRSERVARAGFLRLLACVRPSSDPIFLAWSPAEGPT